VPELSAVKAGDLTGGRPREADEIAKKTKVLALDKPCLASEGTGSETRGRADLIIDNR
jgi:hypothetical protein